ncbi:MAG: hypothetical protein QOF02_1232 [Blastocatellia bacterium]|jgi:uncharacterized protein YecE (DUF72 family)|nr:hypothetical protein [Blastocatellia bacterium]
MSERIEVGCQGWNYEDWVTGPAGGESIFYPRGTRSAGMLEIYARVFSTVEVDSTFYAVPSAKTVDGWARRTPPHFTFALKLPQEITHEHALRLSCRERLAEFCDHASLLGDKLAAVLIQLPPQFEMSPENARALREFLPLLPSEMRFSIEFRSPEWLDESMAELLGKHNVAPALVEGQWLAPERVRRMAEIMAADFAYVRWMGERDLTRFDIAQRPQDENLEAWSQLLAKLSERVPKVFAYFSNFYEGHAPLSAARLKRLLGQPTLEPEDLEDQPSLF